MNSVNGWMKEDNMPTWLEQVLFPYVKTNPCLLLMDSYEAHMTSKVKEALAKYKNIKVGIIVGGTTDTSQPLDNGTNKSFKDSCRKKSIEYTNALLKAAHEARVFEGIQTKVSQTLVESKHYS